MAQLIPVDHDPFDMAASLATAGGDPLVPPPRNPAMPADWAQNAVRRVGGGLADILMAPRRAMDQGMTTAEAVPWAGDMALNMAGAGGPGAAAGALGAAGGKLVQPAGIRAYHGSPHDFDRFDLSKIGTGEGAQSYGHGLYFAENPAVAESYKTAGINSRAGSSAEALAVSALARGQSAADLRKLADMQRGLGETGDAYEKAASMIEAGIAKKPKMYEVNINAKPEQFLDWDRAVPMDNPARGRLRDLSEMGLAAHEYGVDRNFAKEAYLAANNPSLSGEGAYRAMVNGIEAARPKLKEAGNPRALFGNPSVMAAEDLRDAAGVPGLKYLDQGSRGIGEGTRNYVVFDDKIIDILHKYGIGGLSMLPPAVAAHVQSRLIPVDHDPFAQ